MRVINRLEQEDATDFVKELGALIEKHNPKVQNFVVCLNEGPQVSFVADACKIQSLDLLAQILRNIIGEANAQCCEHQGAEEPEDTGACPTERQLQ